MKTLIVTVLIAVGLTSAGFSQSERTFHSIVVRDERPARRSTFIIDYDCGFAWVGQNFGDHRDFGGNTPPGVFVHSKAHDRWLQILQVSTTGAKFGKSPPHAMIQAPWDFTALASRPFVPLPIPTSGAIHLPDKVVYDDTRGAFVLYFDSDSNIGSVTTLLVLKKDLIEAFDYY